MCHFISEEVPFVTQNWLLFIVVTRWQSLVRNWIPPPWQLEASVMGLTQPKVPIECLDKVPAFRPDKPFMRYICLHFCWQVSCVYYNIQDETFHPFKCVVPYWNNLLVSPPPFAVYPYGTSSCSFDLHPDSWFPQEQLVPLHLSYLWGFWVALCA